MLVSVDHCLPGLKGFVRAIRWSQSADAASWLRAFDVGAPEVLTGGWHDPS